MTRKCSMWIFLLASAAMLFALDRTTTCTAQQPAGPTAMTDNEDDWDVPPPGPREKNTPPAVQRRAHHPAEKVRPEEGMVPPPVRKPLERPAGGPPGEQTGSMMPPGMSPFDDGPRGPGDPQQGPGGPHRGGPGGPPQGDRYSMPPGPMGPQAPYAHGYSPRGGYGYGGRMWGPFFGGGFAFSGEQDPEMLELAKKEQDLEMKVGELTNDVRQAEGEKRDKIKTTLREIVMKQFDLRQEKRRLELKRLEEGLKRMRDIIEKRDKAREQIINRHLSELLGEEDELRF
jgi:hypothetical protein